MALRLPVACLADVDVATHEKRSHVLCDGANGGRHAERRRLSAGVAERQGGGQVWDGIQLNSENNTSQPTQSRACAMVNAAHPFRAADHFSSAWLSPTLSVECCVLELPRASTFTNGTVFLLL